MFVRTVRTNKIISLIIIYIHALLGNDSRYRNGQCADHVQQTDESAAA